MTLRPANGANCESSGRFPFSSRRETTISGPRLRKRSTSRKRSILFTTASRLSIWCTSPCWTTPARIPCRTRNLSFLKRICKQLRRTYRAWSFFTYRSGSCQFHLAVERSSCTVSPKQYGVSAVVSGHTHQFVKFQRDGIQYLDAGSSGASLARGLNSGLGAKDGWSYGWTLCTVRGMQVEFNWRETR